LFFVNSLGMPQHTGLIFWVVALIVIHISGIWLSFRRNKSLHFGMMVSALLLMGWGSYVMVPLRAAASTEINMNAPDNVFSLNNYINRTQYGSRPLVSGVHAWAIPSGWEPRYQYYFDDNEGRYNQVSLGTQFHYNEEDFVWFPRLYSNYQHHQQGYEWWTGVDASLDKPRFSNQVDFFLKYQMGHNYLRYLMWNFVGRQNDQQGHGDMLAGNWATGIKFIDTHMLGSRTYISSGEKYSLAANHYFGIPLLLVVLGFLFLLRGNYRRRQVLIFLGLIVVMTGPAIVVYLNQPPFEPRERDYVFVASFMSMALFASFGTFALLRKVFLFSGSLLTGWLTCFLLFLAGPGLLFSVNFNDHDRSGRYLARDLAVSQLRSCPPDAVLFTYGDNDTYPLWYAQQVEQVRPDVRLINLGLLNTFWYVRQVLQATPGNPGLKMELPLSFYRQNMSRFFDVSNIPSAPMAGDNALQELICTEGDNAQPNKGPVGKVHPVWEIPLQNNRWVNWEISAQYLSFGNLVMADIIVCNGSRRPVCFTRNVETSDLGGLNEHFVSQGMVWMLDENMPPGEIDHRASEAFFVFMDSISMGREEQAWWDNTCRQAVSVSDYRHVSIRLARNLLENGAKDKAAKVLLKSLNEWPFSPYVNHVEMLDLVRLLYMSGEEEQAAQLLRGISQVNMEDVFFYFYSGFDDEGIRRNYCGLLREIRALASQLELTGVLLETEMELNVLCGFQN
jgi:energy-coupling factor transporter transmembrane protein EcfT